MIFQHMYTKHKDQVGIISNMCHFFVLGNAKSSLLAN
jgi:hypothetical protein